MGACSKDLRIPPCHLSLCVDASASSAPPVAPLLPPVASLPPPPLLPLDPRPGIPQRHRPVEHQAARLRFDGVGAEVAEPLELVATVGGGRREAGLELAAGEDFEGG